MKETARRDFQVIYYEKDNDENTWVVKSHLCDDSHDITVTVEINMPKMEITDVSFHFERCPLEQCRLMDKKAAELIGIKVDGNFSRNMMSIVFGPHGCPNIMTLLNIAIPGIIYYYYPHLVKKGKMTSEEYWRIMKTEHKTECLAHTVSFE